VDPLIYYNAHRTIVLSVNSLNTLEHLLLMTRIACMISFDHTLAKIARGFFYSFKHRAQ
jgi:hypothetical protein